MVTHLKAREFLMMSCVFFLNYAIYISKGYESMQNMNNLLMLKKFIGAPGSTCEFPSIYYLLFTICTLQYILYDTWKYLFLENPAKT